MSPPFRGGDAGQAFPIYVAVVGGLLFLALAYLAVGQAAVNRNGAQTAADAAALAAAQDRRDQLADAWVETLLDPAHWGEIFDGDVTVDPSCPRADQLAAQNDADVLTCEPLGLLGYRVEVETNESVGASIVPGTEDKHAKASATAVIESLCTFDPADAESKDLLPRLTCEDRDWEFDPKDKDPILPEPQDLFTVHLAE
ncbi:pilus assembly protein TadG-related protein [Streptomyces sp. NPDC047725]|uniref:pilus assembly protein TadG-related protein n=1 Tax=Streptomyces sp. NPDC047725 TaxID=3365487 RepID=UPI0037154D8B